MWNHSVPLYWDQDLALTLTACILLDGFELLGQIVCVLLHPNFFVSDYTLRSLGFKSQADKPWQDWSASFAFSQALFC